MSSVNKVIELYIAGNSIPQVSEITGLSRSTVRHHVLKAGALRTRAEGVRMAGHRVSDALRGQKRQFTPEHCAAIGSARRSWGEENAVGTSLKASGYVVFTRGPNKDRGVHVVEMESRLGRRIRDDEVVHHIDGDRSNNHIDNLALMTRKAHSRLHRFEDQLAGKIRERDGNGRLR